ncbi:hypothetical protein DFH08DRAFT_1087970 [Mycena albidolilacea]|uniref:Uncharacterized protein n=1 Tax=Mycena albidolilacea TaxID=1033008 RepID=A0AAD6Z7T4_9AGAR|nr:hypothetical protein DFH08DRAFT_1087970 [Mycena albidolilacea]
MGFTDEMAVSLEKQGDVLIIQTVSGVTVASVSSAGKWEKAVKGKHEKAEKERKKKAKGKGKEKEVVVRQTKKASTHVRARSRSQGTASDMLKDHRRPVTHDSGAESDNDDPRLKEHGRRVAVHTAPGPSHRRLSSGTAPAPGPSSSTRTPPTANTRTMSKRERKELLEWLQREKDADAAEEANISRIKFRLQYNQEQSPLFYGEIQVLGAGESQTEGEKHMIYWDKNFNQWVPFPRSWHLAEHRHCAHATSSSVCDAPIALASRFALLLRMDYAMQGRDPSHPRVFPYDLGKDVPTRCYSEEVPNTSPVSAAIPHSAFDRPVRYVFFLPPHTTSARRTTSPRLLLRLRLFLVLLLGAPATYPPVATTLRHFRPASPGRMVYKFGPSRSPCTLPLSNVKSAADLSAILDARYAGRHPGLLDDNVRLLKRLDHPLLIGTRGRYDRHAALAPGLPVPSPIRGSSRSRTAGSNHVFAVSFDGRLRSPVTAKHPSLLLVSTLRFCVPRLVRFLRFFFHSGSDV